MSAGSTGTMRGDPQAHDLLRAAHSRTYHFPSDFRGFRASIRYSGEALDAAGTVVIRGPQAIDLNVPAPAEVIAWVRGELASLIGHRWPVPYDESDGRFALSLHDDGHPLGCLIRFDGDPYGSSYRLDGSRITQILRTRGSMRLTITVQEHAVTSDERLLPMHFTVAYWDLAMNRLTRVDTYSDQYAGVDGLYLPTLRRVVTATDSGVETRQLRLSDHRLLAHSGQ